MLLNKFFLRKKFHLQTVSNTVKTGFFATDNSLLVILWGLLVTFWPEKAHCNAQADIGKDTTRFLSTERCHSCFILVTMETFDSQILSVFCWFFFLTKYNTGRTTPRSGV